MKRVSFFVELWIIMVIMTWLLFAAPSFAQWSTNPNLNNPICTAANDQLSFSLAGDGVAGAIIALQDNRFGDYDIYAQNVNATGLVLWGVDGISICNELFNQVYPTVMSSGTGEVIISWQDVRNGTNADIYSQRIIVSGEVQWSNNGVAICTEAGGQSSPVMTSDGAGGGIIAWWDYRNGSTSDIYAQQINSSGQLGVITEIQDDLAVLPESIRLDQNYPNPFRPNTTIRFFVPRCSQVSLKVHNLLGQEVAILVNEIKPPGLYEVNWNASNLKGGLYVYQITVGDQLERKKLILLQ